MRSMRNLASDATTALFVIGALVTLIMVVAPRLARSRPSTSYEVPGPIPAVLDSGQLIGARTARVRITEFSDFQCEYCAQLQPALRRLLRDHGSDVAIVFKHFPLEMIHPNAFGAALASECAAEQGAFQRFHDYLFEHRELIGRYEWLRFAQDAVCQMKSGLSNACLNVGTRTAYSRTSEPAERSASVEHQLW